ncbi:MAG: HEAT repeat domain-containing protein [Planctomycetes bacterium]|nr:HEAT repeat domain-containing protein [Planctomycetota bacterium]
MRIKWTFLIAVGILIPTAQAPGQQGSDRKETNRPETMPTVSEDAVKKIVFAPPVIDGPLPPGLLAREAEETAFMRAHRDAVIPMLKKWAVTPMAEGKGPNYVQPYRWLGRLGSDEEVPFLTEQLSGPWTAPQWLKTESQRRSAGESYFSSVAMALAGIDTPASVAVLLEAIDKSGDNKRRRQALVTDLQWCSQDAAARKARAMVSSDPEVASLALQSAVRIFQRRGDFKARDEVIVEALDHADENVIWKAALYVSEFGTRSAAPKIKEMLSKPDRFDDRNVGGLHVPDLLLTTLHDADLLLTAATQPDSNSALLSLLLERPRLSRGVVNNLVAEPGLADRIRRTLVEMRLRHARGELREYHSMLGHDLVNAIAKFGGTVTPEDRHPYVEDPKTHRWALPEGYGQEKAGGGK